MIGAVGGFVVIICRFRFRDSRARYAALDALRESLRNRIAVIQLGLSTCDAEFDRRAGGDESVPSNSFGVELELIKRRRAKLAHSDQYTARGPQPKVGARDRLNCPVPEYAAFVDGWPDLQASKLSRAQRFESGCGDRERRDLVRPIVYLHHNKLTV